MRPAIVIFGAGVRADGRPSGTLHRRVSAAMTFARQLDRPVFIPTGGVGRFGPSEASVMAALLSAAGVAAEQILLEPTGTDTLSSVRAVRRLLRARGDLHPIYVATSLYHLPRCLLLMRLAGLPARACPPPRVPAANRSLLRWYWRLREIPALPYDVLLVLWLRSFGRL